MVRLVKGAYWDAEIKRAQVGGRPDYPVFTTKAATDLSLPGLRRRAARRRAGALRPVRHPQRPHPGGGAARWPTGAACAVERQRLHGMGEALYAAAARRARSTCRCASTPRSAATRTCCPIWCAACWRTAPTPRFVHALLDERRAARDGGRRPARRACERQPGPHPRIPSRATSCCPSAAAPPASISAIAAERRAAGRRGRGAGSRAGCRRRRPTRRPPTSTAAVRRGARRRSRAWDAAGGAARARSCCAPSPTRIEAAMPRAWSRSADPRGRQDPGRRRRRGARGGRLLPLLRAPSPSASSPARAPLPGPVGETNALELHGRGVFVAISPWNFPLSIFTGQVAAALAAGNAVLAKPAEQTPRIAAEAVRLFHAAGPRPAPAGADAGRRRARRPGADRPSGLRRRRLHRRHRHRLGHQPQAGRRATARSSPSSPRPAASTPCSSTPRRCANR